MRGTRWLILLAIAAILAGSLVLYRRDQRIAREHAPPKPELLGADMNRDALNYEAGQSTDGKTNFSIKARKYRQIRDTPNYELEDLELKLVQRDQQHYDLIVQEAVYVSPRIDITDQVLKALAAAANGASAPTGN